MSHLGVPASKLALSLVLALLLGTALASGLFVRASLNDVVTQIPDSYKACQVNTDCVSVRIAGCSCAPSGQYDQVAKIYLNRFTRPDQCSAAELQDCATAGKRVPAAAICHQNKCMSEAEATAP